MHNMDSTFISHLHDEKLKAQEFRTKFVIRKLIFASVLLGAGSSALNNDIHLLLFIVPFIALIFDFQIMGEDYSVKRIGLYLKHVSPSRFEQCWERVCKNRRDPFAPLSHPLLSGLITITALGIFLTKLRSNNEGVELIYIAPFILALLVNIYLFFHYFMLKKNIEQKILEEINKIDVQNKRSPKVIPCNPKLFEIRLGKFSIQLMRK